MSDVSPVSLWQRWVRQPQKFWLRRALFQVHLWTGIVVGVYILMISVTGSVLVYRNELYVAATPERAIPSEGRRSVPAGIRFMSNLLDLHDNLFAGETGRRVNGLGALAVLTLAATGLVIWWPGIKTWRRSLVLHRGVGWKRMTWDLHSMLGFWSLGFTLVFAISGIYLAYPEVFQDIVERLEPLTPANAGVRIGDRITYWVAILHFGRINGIGFPCRGRGICDQTTKAIWAVFGLAPAAMFVTGAILWWNRVGRSGWRALRRSGLRPGGGVS